METLLFVLVVEVRPYLSIINECDYNVNCFKGGFGNFHWGVIKALVETGYLPKIISGTSAGAVVAAVVATRTKEGIQRMMSWYCNNSKRS